MNKPRPLIDLFHELLRAHGREPRPFPGVSDRTPHVVIVPNLSREMLGVRRFSTALRECKTWLKTNCRAEFDVGGHYDEVGRLVGREVYFASHDDAVLFALAYRAGCDP